MLRNRTRVEKIGGVLFLATMGIMVYGFIKFLSPNLSSLTLASVVSFFLTFLMVGFLTILSIGGVLYWIVSFVNALEKELNPD